MLTKFGSKKKYRRKRAPMNYMFEDGQFDGHSKRKAKRGDNTAPTAFARAFVGSNIASPKKQKEHRENKAARYEYTNCLGVIK